MPTDPGFENDPEFSERAIRIQQIRSSENCVVLHAASTWNYELDGGLRDFLPPLHSFLDSMIGFWLNISAADYDNRFGFALYISCQICYCYYLESEGEPVKSARYARKLKTEHREVHYNICATDPKVQGFTTTNRHRYHVRKSREIKDGLFVPKPYKEQEFRAELTTVAER